MCLKSILIERTSGVQLFVLLLLIVMGSFLGGVGGMCFFSVIGVNAEGMADNPEAVRGVQAIASIAMFMLPAFLWAWLCGRGRVRDTLGIGQVPPLRSIVLALVGLLLLLPLVRLMEHFNMSITLPPSLSDWEVWMRQQEASADRLLHLLSAQGTLSELAANLAVVAAVAAFTEELLFRGVICRLLSRRPAGLHATAWCSALFFCAIHMQFYTFLPRLVLGVYLGYLFCLSGNLWLPVAVHFANNAIAVVAMSYAPLRPLVDSSEPLAGLKLWACAGAAFIGYLLVRHVLRNVAVAAKPLLFILLPAILLFTACGDRYPHDDLLGKWQLAEVHDADGEVRQVDTVWYNFQYALFQYQLFDRQTGSYHTCVGYREPDEDGFFRLFLADGDVETFRRQYTDWPETYRRFRVTKRTRKQLILITDDGVEYHFRRFG
ncbi:MAG: CPBP family intramembrane metalloprotease [Tannerellaceae bacterium]|jgi:membrane protease YdiL (CAAX protease family)|nr:CPBP family intramembrane metalloprotease [Tannerellaceae bacterium]